MKDYEKWFRFCTSVFMKHGTTETDAEEFSQDAMVRLLQTKAEIKDVKTYLYTVCLNLLRHSSRGRKRFYKAAAPLYFSQRREPTPLEVAITNEDHQGRVLDMLSPRQRRILTLYIDKGGKSGKTADGTNVPAAVRQVMFRVRRDLRDDPRIRSLLA